MGAVIKDEKPSVEANVTSTEKIPVITVQFVSAKFDTKPVETPKREVKEEKPYLRNIDLSTELQKFTYEQALKSNVPYNMVLAVMEKESHFDPKARNVNKNGSVDVGIMQINSGNHAGLRKALGSLDFTNPEDSIRAGVYILSNLYRKYDDETTILMAYNMGEGGMRSAKSNGIYSTQYSRAVLNYKKQIGG